MAGPDSDFIAEVAEEARVAEDEAAGLIEDFLGALAPFVSRELWDHLVSTTPVDPDVDWDQIDRRRDPTVEEFLLEMSEEEGALTRRAAGHARAVAEAIRSRVSPADLEEIAETGDEGILALFERLRGEMTTPEAPTPGEEQRLGSGESGAEAG